VNKSGSTTCQELLMSDQNKHQEPISLWHRSATEDPAISPMSGDIDTNVAIVGGGFTGLSTASHLAEKGVDAQVFEAEATICGPT
jgi:heterodisulfide reductase subunit A-like polyferredoxin